MKKKASEPARDEVVVEALAHFKHDGKDVAPRDRLTMSTANASELVAINFARLAKLPERV